MAYLVGATLLNTPRALTTCVILMLGFLLFGGYFAPNIPHWLTPVSYLSPVSYGFQAMLQVYFASGVHYRCVCVCGGGGGVLHLCICLHGCTFLHVCLPCVHKCTYRVNIVCTIK